MSLRFLAHSLPALALSATLPLLAGCSGSLPDGTEIGFLASGDIAVTDHDARPAALVGHLRVDGDRVEGTIAFTDGGSPLPVKGTVEGTRLHFEDLDIINGGDTISGFFTGASTFHAKDLDITPELAADGSITSVTISASGEVTDSGGDLVSTAPFEIDFAGGPDASAPEIAIFNDAVDRPRGPVDPIEILFTEPVAASALDPSSLVVEAGGKAIPIEIELPESTGDLAVRATIKPRGHWPFGADLAIRPAGALADMNGNLWAKGLVTRGTSAAEGTLAATTFEYEVTTPFMTPAGPAEIESLPPLLASQDQKRALLVPPAGAWARVDLPSNAKAIRMRVAYVMAGFGAESEPDWVLEQLGWDIHVAGESGQIVQSRDLVGVSVEPLGESPIPGTVGPIEIVTLDVHELAGSSVVLALRPRSFHLPPVALDGALVVDWIEL